MNTKNPHMKRILTMLCIAIVATLMPKAYAQDYKYDIGVEAGISSYWGDVNQSSLIYRPGFTGGAVFRYVIDYRWAIRANLSAAMLSGNATDDDNILPGGDGYQFSTTLFDAGCRAEFNFFNYGVGQKHQPVLTLYYCRIGVLCRISRRQQLLHCQHPLWRGCKVQSGTKVELGTGVCHAQGDWRPY